MADKMLDISELQKEFINSTQTDEPVAIQTQTDNVVNGDTTKFGTNEPQDYSLTFWLPVTDRTPSDATLVMNNTAYVQTVTAKQKFITARVARKVRSYASTITLAFTELKENGDSDLYTPEDLLKVYEVFDDDVIEACEKLVCEVLDVSPNLIEYITDVSLVEVCSKIIANNPAFFQAD